MSNYSRDMCVPSWATQTEASSSKRLVWMRSPTEPKILITVGGWSGTQLLPVTPMDSGIDDDAAAMVTVAQVMAAINVAPDETIFLYAGDGHDPAHKALMLAVEPHVFPGGYPRYAVTDDGGALCHKCAEKEFDSIYAATPGDGWHIEALVINYEDTELFCDHCNEQIESAYGADDE